MELLIIALMLLYSSLGLIAYLILYIINGFRYQFGNYVEFDIEDNIHYFITAPVWVPIFIPLWLSKKILDGTIILISDLIKAVIPPKKKH